jgi:hypothetical protein
VWSQRSHAFSVFPFDRQCLIVDVVSHLLVLLGLRRISSRAVFTELQRYRTNFQPSVDHDVNPEMNLFNTQHVRADAGSQFASQEFVELCNRNNIRVSVASPKHQEMNGLCERTWQSLQNLAFAAMNHARVGEEFGDMALEHAWKVFSVLPLRDIQHGDITTTPYELHYGRKPSLRKFRVLFCPCVYKVYQRTHRASSSGQSSFAVRRCNLPTTRNVASLEFILVFLADAPVI